MFASGAGSWGSLFTFQPDGSFTGDYRDSEMVDGCFPLEEWQNGSVGRLVAP